MTWHDFGAHRVWAGDNLDALRSLPDASIDAVVTDPPYGLAFMGRRWDYDVTSEALWREVLRVAKPGAHLLAFGGSRTFHRIAVRVEDAGWELRDTLMWLYGSGFPKSLDVSKAIDKAAGAERERVLVPTRKGNSDRLGLGGQGSTYGDSHGGFRDASEPATDLARAWSGWGTALKPAHEPVILARRPLDGTVAANVERWGVGGLNIDGCRVPGPPSVGGMTRRTCLGIMNDDGWTPRPGTIDRSMSAGRWPANVLHDGSDEVQLAFAAFGESKPKPGRSGRQGGGGGAVRFGTGGDAYGVWPDDPGGTAARFFYCAKASRSERAGSRHPTVKPLALMRYLVRLVTPPGGVVLDPFLGSGTTMLAAEAEGARCIGMEREHVEDVALRWGAR